MRKIWCVIRMAIADGFQYRADLLIFVLAGVVRPFVLLFFWLATLSSGAKTPYTAAEFIEYYLLVMAVGVIVSVWSAPFISSRIRHGRISPWLLKPMPYLSFDLGNNIGEKIFKCVYLVPLVTALVWLFDVHFRPLDWFSVLAFLSSLTMAFFINYLLNFCAGAVAFWLDDSGSVEDLIDFFSFIFSGRLVPLIALPIALQIASVYLPFRYTLSLPIEIAMGKIGRPDMLIALGIQAFWLAVTTGLCKFLWNGGLRRYSASGA